jgi:hypothetical protein
MIKTITITKSVSFLKDGELYDTKSEVTFKLYLCGVLIRMTIEVSERDFKDIDDKTVGFQKK